MTEPLTGPASDQPSAPPPQRRRVTSATAVIGLLVGLLAFAIVVQVHSNSQDSQLSAARPDDLVRILSDLTSREQRLRAEIAKLEQTRSQLSSGAQGREAALAEARRRADELGILAGTLAAQGPGLRIRLLPGEGGLPATTVLEAIEELRGSGAEAMQISGGDGQAVRIVAATAFVDGAAGLVVDDRPLAAPYTITAIGPPQTMRTALTIPGGVVDSVQHDGGTVGVDEPGDVRVDALYTGGELHYAQPVP